MKDKPVFKKALVCPQLKTGKIETLHVNYVVFFVLSHLFEQDAYASKVADAYKDKHGRSIAGLQAILTRLRNGGYIDDVEWVEGGMLRAINVKGIMLYNEIKQALANGYRLRGGSDPRDDKHGNDYPFGPDA